MAISNNTTGYRPGVCTSSSRPTAPYEGQMIYETDTDMVALWNGSAWRYIAATTPTNGTVLQTVYGTATTSVQNNTTTYVDTGLTATITPKSSSSKILVAVSQNGLYKQAAASENRIKIAVLRGSTVLADTGNLLLYTGSAIGSGGSYSISILDEPATTSAVTYKTQFLNPNGTAGVFVQEGSARSTITLMEIAG